MSSASSTPPQALTCPRYRGNSTGSVSIPRYLLARAAGTAREGGKVLLLGAAGELRHDFSPYWFRAISLIGSYAYSAADFRAAVELLPAATGIERLVIPTFPFSDWQTALRTVRERRGLKVAFRP